MSIDVLFSILRHGVFFGLTLGSGLLAVEAFIQTVARKRGLMCREAAPWAVLVATAAAAGAVGQFAYVILASTFPNLGRGLAVGAIGLVLGAALARRNDYVRRRAAWLLGLAAGVGLGYAFEPLVAALSEPVARLVVGFTLPAIIALAVRFPGFESEPSVVPPKSTSPEVPHGHPSPETAVPATSPRTYRSAPRVGVVHRSFRGKVGP